MPLSWVVLALCASAVALSWEVISWWIRVTTSRTSFKRIHGCEPISNQRRYRHKDPLFGLDLIFGEVQALRKDKIRQFYWQCFQRYGETFVAHQFRRSIIHTMDPANVRSVLSASFSDWQHRQHTAKCMREVLGDGILTNDGESWRRSRMTLRPSFFKRQAAAMESYERLVQHMVDRIDSHNGNPFKFEKVTRAFTMDTLTKLLFGASAETLLLRDDSSKTKFQEWADATDHVGRSIVLVALTGKMLTPFGVHKTVKKMHKFVAQFVERTLDAKAPVVDTAVSGHDLYEFSSIAEELALHTDDTRCIAEEIVNLIEAGRETTGTLLDNIVLELSRRRDIASRLRADIAFIEGRPPTYEELNHQLYLKGFINEVLRIHTIIPTMSRQAVRDTVLPRGGGLDGQSPLFVPKDAYVIIGVQAMHWRKDLFGKDSMELDPERWRDIRPGYGFIPFSAGPRTCLGQQLALTEAAYVTVRLLQLYRTVVHGDDQSREDMVSPVPIKNKRGSFVVITT